jgi:hypothetical protein
MPFAFRVYRKIDLRVEVNIACGTVERRRRCVASAVATVCRTGCRLLRRRVGSNVLDHRFCHVNLFGKPSDRDLPVLNFHGRTTLALNLADGGQDCVHHAHGRSRDASTDHSPLRTARSVGGDLRLAEGLSAPTVGSAAPLPGSHVLIMVVFLDASKT